MGSTNANQTDAQKRAQETVDRAKQAREAAGTKVDEKTLSRPQRLGLQVRRLAKQVQNVHAQISRWRKSDTYDPEPLAKKLYKINRSMADAADELEELPADVGKHVVPAKSDRVLGVGSKVKLREKIAQLYTGAIEPTAVLVVEEFRPGLVKVRIGAFPTYLPRAHLVLAEPPTAAPNAR